MGIIADVEQILWAAGKPYIAVDEAKKALFAGAKLKSFHYVVYFTGGNNWLVSCGNPSADTRADMKQWGEIFGSGFIVVYATRRKAGIVFRGPGGVYLDLEGKASIEPAATTPTPTPPMESPTVDTPGVQGSLLGERYEGGFTGRKTAGLFGDIQVIDEPMRACDTETMNLFA